MTTKQNIDTIREGLDDAYQHFLGMWQMATGPLTKADADMKINRNRDAIAALDELEKQLSQQPKRLTDEEIDRAVTIEHRRLINEPDVFSPLDESIAFKRGIYYAINHGYLGGLSIDEVMEAVDQEPELPDDMPDEMWEACRSHRHTMQEAMRVVVRLTKEGIRARLTAKLNEK
jgi:uncharacterized protein YjgD (DUF1641 family)